MARQGQVASAVDRGAPPGRFKLRLLGRFEISRNGEPAPALTAGSQRLIALLALREHSFTRNSLADTLWPDSTEEHAHSSLRSAIIRLPLSVQGAIVVGNHELHLSDEVDVDLQEARSLAHRLLHGPDLLQPEDAGQVAIEALAADILPDWVDEWAVVEAEGWRQLRLHALEAIALHLLSARRYGDAADAALLTIQADPLRQTPHVILMRIHIAEGNQSEALAAFERYRALLLEELGIEPTQLIASLLNEIQDTP